MIPARNAPTSLFAPTDPEPLHCLTAFQNILAPHRETLAAAAVAAALVPLRRDGFPDESALAASRSAAESVLRKGILDLLENQDHLPNAPSGTVSSRRLLREISLPPLILPAPEDTAPLPPTRIALAAAGGALAGMLVGAPCARTLFGNADLGLLLGALGGAAGVVRGLMALGDSPPLQRFLWSALGVAVLGEGWGLLSGGWPFRSLWRLLGGHGSGLRRLGLYLLVVGILLATRRPRRFSSSAYTATLKACALQWMEGALRGIALTAPLPLTTSETTASNRSAREQQALIRLAEEVHGLRTIPGDTLPQAVQDLAQDLLLQGVSADDTPPTHWEVGMEAHYDTFGRVEPGDSLLVERVPLFFEGALIRRGLVRKNRRPS